MRSRTIKLLILLLSLLIAFTVAVYAEEITDTAEFYGISKNDVTDGELLTHCTVTEFTITSNEPIYAIYIEYNKTAVGGMMEQEIPIAQNGFLHEFIEVGGLTSVTLSYNEADICDIRIFGEGDIPDDIERWETAPEGVDLLLLATHSDDDQLFFAGLLPYYASVEGARVAVAYFVNHYDTYNRTHELLHGLWHCGVKYYPEISPFPDGYSESVEGAKSFLSSRGITDSDVQDFHKMLLERYKPLVVVLHDFKGEYGHGAHMHSTESFIEALEATEGSSVEKVYVHLYDENPIMLDIDTPLDAFDGKSAFQVSQEAFSYHLSQHWTWFYSWIYGKSAPITSSTQITSYNPARYGLYYTSVGADTSGCDMLENVVTYAEREKISVPEITEQEITETVEPEIFPTDESIDEALPTEEESGSLSPYKAVVAAIILIIVILIITAIKRKKK